MSDPAKEDTPRAVVELATRVLRGMRLKQRDGAAMPPCRDDQRKGDGQGGAAVTTAHPPPPGTEEDNVECEVDLGEQLREAMRQSGLNRYQIAKRAGLSYGALHGFTAREKDLYLSTASKIASLLGVELREVRRSRG